MSILPVLTMPNPILRQKALPVTVFDSALLKLLEDMVDTMRSSDGVGLAGPQVGILQRIFVAEYKKRLFMLVNPEFVSLDGVAVGQEGCLSLPGVYMMVERARKVVLRAQLPDGKPIEFPASRFLARIFQHEMDHLDGILITDRSSIVAEK